MIKPLVINLDGPKDFDLDFKKMMAESYIDPSEEIKTQPVCISIGTNTYKGNEYPVPFGSYGDFSCIVGASKSRKTFLKSMVIASFIGGNSNLLIPSFKGHRKTDSVVIEFDTEQSKFHAQRVVRRVCDMVGGNYGLYKTYGLRPYSPRERFEFIEYIIMESEFKNNIGLISIDGYVDLVTDFNSLEQASGLVEKLMKWTSLGNLHCTGVLHKNFGSDKPVGHVGSAVLKKAETIVFVEKDGDFTNVKCEYSRNIPFEDFSFGVNSDWLPYEIENQPKRSWI